MEQKDQEPFDREAWRKLLAAEAGAPTKEIDRRILAEARRARAPRIGRWWLPASLAASLLLAVLIVQSQLADVGRPAAVTEADVPATLPADASEERGVPLTMTPPGQRQEDSTGADVPVPPPRMDLPNHDSPGASARTAPAAEEPAPPPATVPSTSAFSTNEEPALPRDQATDAVSAADAELPAQAAAEKERAEEKSTGMLGALKANESYAESRTPEQWYKDIAALRASGQVKEADAELARFKSKFPGWLEGHQKKDP
jgi:hypothetical protein